MCLLTTNQERKRERGKVSPSSICSSAREQESKGERMREKRGEGKVEEYGKVGGGRRIFYSCLCTNARTHGRERDKGESDKEIGMERMK